MHQLRSPQPVTSGNGQGIACGDEPIHQHHRRENKGSPNGEVSDENNRSRSKDNCCKPPNETCGQERGLGKIHFIPCSKYRRSNSKIQRPTEASNTLEERKHRLVSKPVIPTNNGDDPINLKMGAYIAGAKNYSKIINVGANSNITQSSKSPLIIKKCNQ